LSSGSATTHWPPLRGFPSAQEPNSIAL
jgi:hypothetical protein